MLQQRRLQVGVAFATLLGALALGRSVLTEAAAQAGSSNQVPMFEPDPMWPKQLPNKWVLGNVIGVAVDSKDNIWMLHRPSGVRELNAAEMTPPKGTCCFVAPPVLVFDQAGNLLKYWQWTDDARTFPGPGVKVSTFPKGEHGIYVDYKDNIWLADNDPTAGAIYKFTQDGKLLLTVGNPKAPAKDSNDTTALKCPTNMFVEPTANEVYVTDGYCNRRVIVFDADTGQYKRHWGAYGKPPNDADAYNSRRGQVDKDYDPDKVSQQFGRATHNVEVSKDGLVYINDRTNNRIQVFTKDGRFLQEVFLNKHARWYGASWETAFSPDPAQRFLYNANGNDQQIQILDRKTMQIVGAFGQGGNRPGEFYALHSIATDSKGNIYTGETIGGDRFQRLIFKGLGPARPQ
jgi:DNA-binding beta-propeller fold protein YncE